MQRLNSILKGTSQVAGAVTGGLCGCFVAPPIYGYHYYFDSEKSDCERWMSPIAACLQIGECCANPLISWSSLVEEGGRMGWRSGIRNACCSCIIPYQFSSNFHDQLNPMAVFNAQMRLRFQQIQIDLMDANVQPAPRQQAMPEIKEEADTESKAESKAVRATRFIIGRSPDHPAPLVSQVTTFGIVRAEVAQPDVNEPGQIVAARRASR